jgi:hypothetical protein
MSPTFDWSDPAVLMRRALPRRHRRAAVAAACLSLLSLPASGFAGQAAAAPGPGTPTPSAGTLTIDHRAPGCLTAGKYARLAACFRPEAALARARLYFRAGGTRDWFYVEMSGAPPCLEGVLPRPKKGVRQVEYYLAATDRSFAESRTPERALPVTDDGTCPAGPVAPVAPASSAVIGSASGAAPVGFATGGGLSPLLIAGGVAVIGGGAAAVVAGGGGGGETSPTTTLPPVTTTTTTTTATTTTTTTTTLQPTPTTTTTTTRPPCETPNQPPTVNITSPTTGPLGGLQVTVNANASDPAPSPGVKEVRFYWQYCPAGVCGTQNVIDTDTTSPYGAVWVFPTCGSAPEDRFRILARAEDNCGNVSTDANVDVRLTGRPCFRGDAQSRPAGAWVSELSVPGGRGQVVVDGAEAVFPAGGMETFSTSTGPGSHRFEATLVDGAGRPGTWRFDLSALSPVPGSLRVVAGEAAVTGPAAVVFRLRGKPGERVVFSFDVGGRQ